jgi:hypothetical protein
MNTVRGDVSFVNTPIKTLKFSEDTKPSEENYFAPSNKGKLLSSECIEYCNNLAIENCESDEDKKTCIDNENSRCINFKCVSEKRKNRNENAIKYKNDFKDLIGNELDDYYNGELAEEDLSDYARNVHAQYEKNASKLRQPDEPEIMKQVTLLEKECEDKINNLSNRLESYRFMYHDIIPLIKKQKKEISDKIIPILFEIAEEEQTNPDDIDNPHIEINILTGKINKLLKKLMLLSLSIENVDTIITSLHSRYNQRQNLKTVSYFFSNWEKDAKNKFVKRVNAVKGRIASHNGKGIFYYSDPEKISEELEYLYTIKGGKTRKQRKIRKTKKNKKSINKRKERKSRKKLI